MRVRRKTDNVTCTSQQTGEVFDCEFVGMPDDFTDQYSCTEIEEEQPGQQQPAAGGGGATPITQEGEQESEAGEIDQSFDVS